MGAVEQLLSRSVLCQAQRSARKVIYQLCASGKLTRRCVSPGRKRKRSSWEKTIGGRKARDHKLGFWAPPLEGRSCGDLDKVRKTPIGLENFWIREFASYFMRVNLKNIASLREKLLCLTWSWNSMIPHRL